MLHVMSLTKVVTDVFGSVTIVLFALMVILGILCIYRCFYFQLLIRRQGLSQLSYFNGPWIMRIILISVSLWWVFGEVVRLSFLRGQGRPFSSVKWQKFSCKFYIMSNLGFAEPLMFLMLAFLLHAALQKRDSGTLSQRWNMKTFCYIILLCLPLFILQLVLVFLGPKYNNEEFSRVRKKMAKFFASSSSTESNISICTYPLMSTIFLGFFYVVLISYVFYVGAWMLSFVINKGLRRRVGILVISVIFFLPLRVLLLGFSVLPHVGNLAYEALIFLAFLMLLLCTMVGICMLVYFPVSDSLALRDITCNNVAIVDMPYDDYYSEGAYLIPNHSHQDTERNSDTSTKRGSISFRTMIKDDSPVLDGIEESRSLPFASLQIVSPAGNPPYIEGDSPL